MSDPLGLAIREIRRLLVENEELLISNERRRGVIERLEIEKHDLAERLAAASFHMWKDAQ